MSIQQVWRRLKNLRQEGRDREGYLPHTLRPTFATDLYRETGRIRLVQKGLGHADLSHTLVLLTKNLKGR